MMLETTIALLTFAAFGILPPTEEQRSRDRRGTGAAPLREQVAALRRVGLIRRR